MSAGASAETIPVAAGEVAISENGICSLREAIINANEDYTHADCAAGSGPDIITLPAGTYTTDQDGADEDLSETGDLDILSDITINGAGAATTIIQASATAGAATDRVFHVLSGANLQFSDVTVRHGLTCCNGGGILNQGILALTDSIVTLNQADRGGGIYSTVTANQADKGGGIYHSFAGDLTLLRATLSDNTADKGGGLLNNLGDVGITDSTVSGNTGTTQGGGIINTGTTMSLTGSTVSGNTAGGNGGAGIFNRVPLTLTNSTISGNRADGSGGGIHNSGSATLTLHFVTIANNTADNDNDSNGDGGAIFNLGASVTLDNTILKTGDRGVNLFNISGTITSNGYNLSNDNGGGFLTGTGDQINTEPMLGPLKDNGGPTLTRAPLIGSPAIDQGGAGGTQILALSTDFDQRGFTRPVNDPAVANAGGGDASDIGAVELAEFVHPDDAVSRKTHGAAGAFDVDLPLMNFANSPIGIECRTGGSNNNHRIIVTFDPGPITFSGAAVTDGTGSVVPSTSSSRPSLGPDGSPPTQVTINLTGVANAQIITVALFDVDDGTNISDVGVRMGKVLGDTTESEGVNSSDIAETKSKSGQTANATNFRTDVTANGLINSSDIGLVKSKSGTGLP